MRSMRRHHAKRIKVARRHYWGDTIRDDPRKLGIVATTPHVQQCDCCCNQRRVEGPTRQEKLSVMKMIETLAGN